MGNVKQPKKPGARMPSDISNTLIFWGILCFWNIVAGIFCQVSDIGAVVGGLMFGIEVFFLPYILIWRFIAGRIHLARQRSFMMVLEYIDQAVRLNLPLPAMLKAASVGEQGWVGRTLQKISKDIENGHSIEHAIRRHYEFVQRRVVAAIGIAEKTGTFNTILPWLIKTEKQRLIIQDARRGMSNGYLSMLLLVTMLMLVFVSILILPKFEKIFDDFALNDPGVFYYTMYVNNWMWGHAKPDQLVPGVMWVILLLISMLFLRLPTFRRWMKYGMYHVPLLGKAFENRHLADVNFVIAQGLSTGLPFDHAIAQARSMEMTPALNRKLTQWDTRLADGASISQSARQAGMPAIMTNLLVGVENTSDAVSTFNFLSSYYASKFSRLWLMVHSVTGPFLILLIGSFVGLAAYALFEPLVKLIWHTVIYSGTY